MKKLLFVEDDVSIRNITSESLLKDGFKIKIAINLQMAKDFYERDNFDLILLDLSLPDGDGMDWAKEIRQQVTCPPIIFFTSFTDIEHVRMGFEMGGADYIKKPFDLEELTLRIKRALNDFENLIRQDRQIGEYTFNPVTNRLVHDGKSHILGRLQAGVLDALSIRPGNLVSKEDLLTKYWGTVNYFTSRNLDSAIVKLREHFREDPSVHFLALKREGYRLVIFQDHLA